MRTAKKQQRITAGSELAVRLMSFAQRVLAAFGLIALLWVALPSSRQLIVGRPAASQQSPAGANLRYSNTIIGTIHGANLSQASLEEREQHALIEFIAKRYRVSDRAVAAFVATAYRAGQEYSLDPVLLLAVMAIESRYNPVAESVVGARGLMQVIPKFHVEKIYEHGGEAALLNPEVNIYVGAQILREYLKRFGQLETALQVYGGAFDEPTFQYASKVLAERARLDRIVRRIRNEA
jgi:soluble lytic murein transglycosylase-like protein